MRANVAFAVEGVVPILVFPLHTDREGMGVPSSPIHNNAERI